MNNQSILLIYAHPDDETLFSGGSIAKYADQGFDAYLVIATRGEKGRTSGECTQDELATTREQEVIEVGQLLGIKEIIFLGYGDKTLTTVNSMEISHKIAKIIRKIRPQVIITFGPEGANGHEDHKAIHNFAIASIKNAGDETLAILGNKPFIVPKVYYVDLVAQLEQHLGFEEKSTSPTTVINIKKFASLKLKALQSHRTQALSLNKFIDADDRILHYVFDQETFTLATKHSLIHTLNSANFFD